MTKKLYDDNPYIKEFRATVVSCESIDKGYAIVLDKTAFFPEAGGQKSDRGKIGQASVLEVIITETDIIHITDLPLEVGNSYDAFIDWDRRFDFMQQHSGEHIVSGVAHRLFGTENVGFHLSEDIVTLDFDKPLSASQIEEVEMLANKAIYLNKQIKCYYPDEKTLEGLNYRSKKELLGDIRIVEIEDTDICACCAPHVARTGEIGIIKLLSTESLRGGVRIELKCGKRAVEDYREKFQNILKISNLLCVKHEESANGVQRILEQNSNLKFEITGLKRELLKYKAEKFSFEKEITCLFEENLEIKDLQFLADFLYKKFGGIRAVFCSYENGIGFAICGEAARLDIWFTDFKATFNVKGGGRNGMVQGTVFSESQEIIDYFK